MLSKIFLIIFVVVLPRVVIEAQKPRGPVNLISDKDLIELSKSLFEADTNNAGKYLKTTSYNCDASSSPKPLMKMDPGIYQSIPTIQSINKIFDFHQNNIKDEYSLVKQIFGTQVMTKAMNFLKDKKLIVQHHDDSFLHILQKLWVERHPYGRNGRTYGLRHVFLFVPSAEGEFKGLHNWIFYNWAEQNNKARCLKFIRGKKLGNEISILKIQAVYDKRTKVITSMFVGTSPELEMALYTVCAFARPNKPCTMSTATTTFQIQTHLFVNQFDKSNIIHSAYPIL